MAMKSMWRDSGEAFGMHSHGSSGHGTPVRIVSVEEQRVRDGERTRKIDDAPIPKKSRKWLTGK